MADNAEPSTPITPRQADARRKNGAKSKGPKTPEGKATSSRNSTKHGMFVKKRHIAAGVLAEDAAEVNDYIDSKREAIYAGDNPVLLEAAEEIALVMLNLQRAHAWSNEAIVYRSNQHEELMEPEYARRQAYWNLEAIELVRAIDTTTHSIGELLHIAIRIPRSMAKHLPSDEDLEDVFPRIGRDAAEQLVRAEIAQIGAEQLIAHMAQTAQERFAKFEMLVEHLRPLVADSLITDDALEAGRRGHAHNSRELTRAIRRFKELKELLEGSTD